MTRKEIIQQLKQPFCYGLLKQTDPELAAEAEAIGVDEFEIFGFPGSYSKTITESKWLDGSKFISFHPTATYRLKPEYRETVLDLKDGEWAGERCDKETDALYYYTLPEGTRARAYTVTYYKDFIRWLFADGTRSRQFGRIIDGNLEIPTHAIFKKGGE